MAISAQPAAAADGQVECPVTQGTANMLGPPFPAADNWYGSEALAVALPRDGTWGVTGPTARIAVKLFLSSVGYRPGMEAHLTVEIDNLNGAVNDAIVRDITNATSVASADDTAMLVGIDFPSPGCWRVTANYFEQRLSFVVRTVDQ